MTWSQSGQMMMRQAAAAAAAPISRAKAEVPANAPQKLHCCLDDGLGQGPVAACPPRTAPISRACHRPHCNRH